MPNSKGTSWQISDFGSTKLKQLKNTFAVKKQSKVEPHIEETATNNENDEDTETICYHTTKRFSVDYPPNIDFYRNTVFAGKSQSKRPTMMDLMNSKQDHELKLENVEEFEEYNQNVLNRSKVGQESWHQPQSTTMLNNLRAFSDNFTRKIWRFNKKNKDDVESSVKKVKTNLSNINEKFGWIEGVLIRCMANIFGVMLYLRISWVAGQAGLLLGSCVILLGTLITTITALSMSAICTNGVVKGGGIYYLISRSLGPEFGGSIGVIYSLANAVGASMYVVGFAETMLDIMKGYDFKIIDGEINDIRIIGLTACIVVVGIIIIGLSFESKMQIVLTTVVYISLVDYVIGTFLWPTEMKQMRGVTGYRMETMSENLFPNFCDGYDFFKVFAVFFPASTGIMAGANISGDLKDPQRAIPLGTLLSIFITTIVYLAILWITGSTVVRDADGLSIPQLLIENSSLLVNIENIGESTSKTLLSEIISSGSSQPLIDSSSAEMLISLQYYKSPLCSLNVSVLVTIGIATSALSSALVSMVAAPKIFQAVCRDKIFPYINLFGKGHGPNKEPRAALFLASIMAFGMILIGFRPSFKFYNKWVSLSGSFMCIFLMFYISWATALLTFFFFALIYFYLCHRKPDVNWGSSMQAHCYRNALQYLSRLERLDDHVKNYRPQIMVLSGNPASRANLIEFAYSITKGTSLMLCAYVVPYEPCRAVYAMIQKLNSQLRFWFKTRHIRGFAVTVANKNLRSGVQTLIQTAGLGKMSPNILLMGYKNIWNSLPDGNEVGSNKSLAAANDYFGIIQDAFLHALSVGILRNGSAGLDITNRLLDPPLAKDKGLDRLEILPKKFTVNSSSPFVQASFSQDETVGKHLRVFRVNSVTSTSLSKPSHLQLKKNGDNMNVDANNRKLSDSFSQHLKPLRRASLFRNRDENFPENNKKHRIRKEVPLEMSMVCSSPPLNKLGQTVEQAGDLSLPDDYGLSNFQHKIIGATIDVWWLADDGGLTLLVPYLLSQQKSFLEGAKLRVFTVSTKCRKIEQEQQNLAALLGKFRIDCAYVNVILDLNKKQPTNESLLRFQELIKPFMKSLSDYDGTGQITEEELKTHEDKTWRHLRLAELLAKHSPNADLIVVSLPVPRSGSICSTLYLSWLEVISRDLPPMLMVRGNQQSVLTFYS